MSVRLVGYALWYYKSRVTARGGPTLALVNRALLDLQAERLRAGEVCEYDAAEAELVISARMQSLRADEPALWRRLMHDLGAAVRSGGPVRVLTVRFRDRIGLRAITVALASYRTPHGEVVFWLRVERHRSRRTP